jgi:hypothetical protein
MTYYKTMSKKINSEKSENQDSMGKTNFFLSTLSLALGHMAACKMLLLMHVRSSRRKNELKTTPQAHTKSNFDVFGVKYAVHSSKRKN